MKSNVLTIRKYTIRFVHYFCGDMTAELQVFLEDHTKVFLFIHRIYVFKV